MQSLGCSGTGGKTPFTLIPKVSCKRVASVRSNIQDPDLRLIIICTACLFCLSLPLASAAPEGRYDPTDTDDWRPSSGGWGWILFVGAVVGVFIIGSRLEGKRDKAEQEAEQERRYNQHVNHQKSLRFTYNGEDVSPVTWRGQRLLRTARDELIDPMTGKVVARKIQRPTTAL